MGKAEGRGRKGMGCVCVGGRALMFFVGTG